VLDVGHGNAAVIDGPDGTVIVDAGPGGGDLLRYLEDQAIKLVDCVVISHADEDHLRGLLAILESDSVEIKEVRVNANAIKATDVWNDVVFSLANSDQAEELDYRVSCVQGDDLPTVAVGVRLEVLGPVKELAGHGPGWTDGSGATATTNSCSVVIRVFAGDDPIAMLPGDIDEMGLRFLLERHTEIRAKVLVYPHHGGNVDEKSTAARNAAFAKALMAHVGPQSVLFSISRMRYRNPRPEVVAAVRAADPGTRVACTQLSRNCRQALGHPPTSAFSHLLDLHARGSATNACCAGTMRIALDGAVTPDVTSHAAFIAAHAPSAL
jgi:competence protein ComEC